MFQSALGHTGKLWSLGEDLEAAQHMDDRGEDDLMVSVVQTIKGMWTRARYAGNWDWALFIWVRGFVSRVPGDSYEQVLVHMSRGNR